MLDLVLTIVVIYLAYRIFYQKNTFLNRPINKNPIQNPNPTNQDSSDDDGEYIDYEEVD
ncbi:MAG: hypothetical protein HRU40_04765 [Saprospiraceae bacterium]|nr:hypothetical protein [Saprospiraceae bacterium]